MYKVIIVDDHPIFRRSLSLLLKNEEIAEVVALASNGIEFLNIIDNYEVDLVLMDISMPEMDGIEATELALRRKPDLNILTLSSFGDETYYYKMVEAGVKGFLLKDADVGELEQAIQIVSEGGSWFSSDLLKKVITKIAKSKKVESDLSEKEIEVVKYVCQGLTNEQIADKLNLSYDSIRWHRSNILTKTGCTNTASLVMYAIKNKIVTV